GCSGNGQFSSIADTGMVGGGGAIIGGDNSVPAPPTSGVGGGSVIGNGKEADFTPVSFAEFNSYVATHPLNNPSNFKLSVELSHVGDNRYGGTVRISDTHAGQNYSGTFESGTGKNQKYDGMHDNGAYEAEYN